MQQNDFFLPQPNRRARDVIGCMRLGDLVACNEPTGIFRACACGSTAFCVDLGTAPHAAGLRCAHCGRGDRWIPAAYVRDFPLDHLVNILPCTRHDHEGRNERVRETLVYACGLMGSEEAHRMLANLAGLHDHKGTLTVSSRQPLGDFHRGCLTKAWETWGNEWEIEFEHDESEWRP